MNQEAVKAVEARIAELSKNLDDLNNARNQATVYLQNVTNEIVGVVRAINELSTLKGLLATIAANEASANEANAHNEEEGTDEHQIDPNQSAQQS